MTDVDDSRRDAWIEMQRRRRAEPGEPLRGGGPGDTSGGMTDDWKASVDRQLERLHGDVRDLLRGLIGVAVFFLLAIGGLYLFINGKSDALSARAAQIDVSATRIEMKADQSSERLKRIEDKLDALSESPRVVRRGALKP